MLSAAGSVTVVVAGGKNALKIRMIKDTWSLDENRIYQVCCIGNLLALLIC